MKFLYIASLLLLPALCQSQATALLLKKNNKTVQRYYPGRTISFFTTDKMPVNGRLDSLVRDSLFLTYFQLVRVPTPWGTFRMDTAGRYPIAFSMANVGALPRKRNRWFEGVLMTGGLGYTALNLVNTVREKIHPLAKTILPTSLVALVPQQLATPLPNSKKAAIRWAKTTVFRW
ncbi:hypothetical protein [Phnomibacter ginsenosidimutans]|uniref:Uncharacterized protein n=1 Tax=Phnomibacter ginsenosidimutans TaxID=2676868 RepID=A0A6I6GXX0_9BACT|nr:hypothetical protein [Phnomibacter ginsenosidimutans]QGW29929.1 hypothetical protein GLV81_19000 [Phnomibacter ginsenosidimutans]